MNRDNVISLAKKRADKAALAILEGGRKFVDEGPDRKVIRLFPIEPPKLRPVA